MQLAIKVRAVFHRCVVLRIIGVYFCFLPLFTLLILRYAAPHHRDDGILYTYIFAQALR